uniref:LRA-2 n=1 Tax=uncultured bacterium BLR2 TaxID=506520 RepID=B5L5V0_9BACT|nr:LRA2 family subclass B3 metallo-beta-lactamase [uncultured bacterium BLR2]ACH58985.1 LRA-2 [uncultured bacterium BLR2]
MMDGIKKKTAAGAAAGSLLMMLGVFATPAAGGEAAFKDCPQCAQWNQQRKPFRIYGNTYFVGTAGLSSILVTSDYGHVLIDGGLAQSAPLIKANIEALGFKLTDVKAILVSHVHPDHAGGVAELQRQSGAQVYALRTAEAVLRTGRLTQDDPQSASKTATITPVPQVWVVQDDQLLGVGALRMRAIATPGHTPGGTSWTWDACEDGNCLKMIYADSLSAVAAGKYRFKDHPEVLQAFASSFSRAESAPCDVLLTPHPDASQLFQRLDPEGGTRAASIKDDTACRRYVQAARDTLARKLASEG